MRLYSIQPVAYWELCQVAGVMTPDPAKVEQDFLPAYDWIRERMARRLTAFSGDYPVWAWVKRPDLRKYVLPADESFVLLTLEVPAERVLISDIEAWHYILNGWFLALTEEEHDKAEQHRPTSEAISQSWEFIFDPERLTPWVTGGDKQACIDRLYPHEVVEVRPIRRRQKRAG